MEMKAYSNLSKSKEAFPENEKEKEKEKSTVSSSIEAFCSETTAHGLAHTVKDGYPLQYRLIWIIIVLLALAGNCWHLSTVIRAYLSYPVQEVTSMKHIPIEFPQVTFCNQLAKSTSNEAAANGNTTYTAFTNKIQANFQALLSYENLTGIAMDDLLGSANGLYSNVDHQHLNQISHTLQDMVIYCTFQGRACDMQRDFRQFFDSSYFNCYTFTGHQSVENSSIGSGPENGLSLIVYTESLVPGMETLDGIYNRYSVTDNAYGLQVQVHETDVLPNPKDAGFNVMTGHSTSAVLTTEKMTKLQSPYGTCTPSTSLNGLSMYSYSSQRCMDLCLSAYIYETCGCVSASYKVPQSISQPYTYCAKLTDNIQTLITNTECEQDAKLTFGRSVQISAKCNCNEPCESFKFKTAVSATVWPGNRFMRDMFFEYVEGHVNKTNLKVYQQLKDIVYNNSLASEMYTHISSNFARINIYFETTSVLERAQVASYTMPTLWSNIGGTIGLWAGLSVITVVEVIFLLLKLVVVCCRKAKPSSIQTSRTTILQSS